METDSRNVPMEIRKLRKKLRQIENLECIDRDLTDEEYVKVVCSYQIADIRGIRLSACIVQCVNQSAT
jgi:hypothetical protein